MSKENLDTNDKIQLIINKLKKNLKLIITLFFIVVLAFSLLTFIKIKKENENILISEKYNKAKVFINNKKNNEGLILLEEVITTKHPFYSPLSLYLILDSNLTGESEKITELFDKVISNNNIDKESFVISQNKLKMMTYSPSKIKRPTSFLPIISKLLDRLTPFIYQILYTKKS